MLAPHFSQSRAARLELPPIIFSVLKMITIATSVTNDENSGKSKNTFMMLSYATDTMIHQWGGGVRKLHTFPNDEERAFCHKTTDVRDIFGGSIERGSKNL
jgi:hypothetical protein